MRNLFITSCVNCQRFPADGADGMDAVCRAILAQRAREEG